MCKGWWIMLAHTEKKASNVHFISYTGKWPCLCSGVLTLQIADKAYKFGYNSAHQSFWDSGGRCGFISGYSESYVNKGEWIIDVERLPEDLRQYAEEIDRIFNENVPHGCCGGCL